MVDPQVEIELRRDRADEQEARIGILLTKAREGAQQLRKTFRRVHVAERAEQRRALEVGRLDRRRGPRGHRHPPDRAVVPACAGALIHVRMDDEARGQLEDFAAQGEILRTGDP